MKGREKAETNGEAYRLACSLRQGNKQITPIDTPMKNNQKQRAEFAISDSLFADDSPLVLWNRDLEDGKTSFKERWVSSRKSVTMTKTKVCDLVRDQNWQV